MTRLLKKTHLLRCIRFARSNVPIRKEQRARSKVKMLCATRFALSDRDARRVFARLASGAFLTGLGKGFVETP